MKISTFHKTRNDNVVLNHPGDVNYISCIFSKTRPLAERVVDWYPNCVPGGPGWDPKIRLPSEIDLCHPDYSLYGIEYGLGRLTEGCPGECPYCIVPQSEGRESKTVAELENVINPHGDLVVMLDANILACPDWPEHFRELRARNLWVDFTQGLDIRYVNDFVASELAKLKYISLAAWLKARAKRKRPEKGLLHFAWDKMENEAHVQQGIKTLAKAGIKPWRLSFYMLVGFDTTWEEDWYRFQVLRDLGVHPFVMLYKGAGPHLRHFARWVNRRLYKVCRWNDYEPVRKSGGEMVGYLANGNAFSVSLDRWETFLGRKTN